jgi:hypothetical protein
LIAAANNPARCAADGSVEITGLVFRMLPRSTSPKTNERSRTSGNPIARPNWLRRYGCFSVAKRSWLGRRGQEYRGGPGRVSGATTGTAGRAGHPRRMVPGPAQPRQGKLTRTRGLPGPCPGPPAS